MTANAQVFVINCAHTFARVQRVKGYEISKHITCSMEYSHVICHDVGEIETVAMMMT